MTLMKLPRKTVLQKEVSFLSLLELDRKGADGNSFLFLKKTLNIVAG